MSFFSAKKTSNTIIGLLILFNVLLLGTLWYRSFVKPSPVQVTPIQKPVQKIDKKQTKHQSRPALLSFLKEQFHFTDTELEQFKKIQEAHFSQESEFVNSVDTLRKQMMALLYEDPVDQDKVDSYASQIGKKIAAHEKMIFSHFQQLLKVKNADDEDAPKYKDFILGMQRNRGQRRKRQHPPDHQPPPHQNFGPDGHGNRPGGPSHGPESIENRLARMDQVLQLDNNQKTQIKKILEEYIPNMRGLPPFEHRQKRQEMNEAIRKLLTDDQRSRFDQNFSGPPGRNRPTQ